MKILTIDSASESFSVSIFDEDKVLSEVFLKRTGKQLTYLAKSIDYAFSMSGLDSFFWTRIFYRNKTC